MTEEGIRREKGRQGKEEGEEREKERMSNAIHHACMCFVYSPLLSLFLCVVLFVVWSARAVISWRHQAIAIAPTEERRGEERKRIHSASERYARTDALG